MHITLKIHPWIFLSFFCLLRALFSLDHSSILRSSLHTISTQYSFLSLLPPTSHQTFSPKTLPLSSLFLSYFASLALSFTYIIITAACVFAIARITRLIQVHHAHFFHFTCSDSLISLCLACILWCVSRYIFLLLVFFFIIFTFTWNVYTVF